MALNESDCFEHILDIAMAPIVTFDLGDRSCRHCQQGILVSQEWISTYIPSSESCCRGGLEHQHNGERKARPVHRHIGKVDFVSPGVGKGWGIGPQNQQPVAMFVLFGRLKQSINITPTILIDIQIGWRLKSRDVTSQDTAQGPDVRWLGWWRSSTNVDPERSDVALTELTEVRLLTLLQRKQGS